MKKVIVFLLRCLSVVFTPLTEDEVDDYRQEQANVSRV